jgi:hypothetical protein
MITLMKGAVPERGSDISDLWKRYDPDVVLTHNSGHITLNANKDRIEFDNKTMEVFWLIGFSGWRAIECYAPLVKLSAAAEQPVAGLIKDDQGLDEVERAYKERTAAARALIDADDPASAPWPPDLPRPVPSRDGFADPQLKVAFDLTCMALAFALLHEFRHVMLDRDNARPSDLREEELACDVWAREFMTVKLAQYAKDKDHQYCEVIQKRSMAFAMTALILHEITPVWIHGGSKQYFSLASRVQAILDGTPLPDDSHFWVFAASLLIGIFRQQHRPIDAPPMSARDLAGYLIDRL